MTEDQFLEFAGNLLDELFPKGKCEERGSALALIAELFVEMKQQYGMFVSDPRNEQK